ncbi:hypothetical protein Q604_UNBC02306G0001, partial [human gut metagenome]
RSTQWIVPSRGVTSYCVRFSLTESADPAESADQTESADLTEPADRAAGGDAARVATPAPRRLRLRPSVLGSRGSVAVPLPRRFRW